MMKTLNTLLVFLALGGASGWAQNYAINWYSVDGGGGASTGATYAVTGTIGQPDAGALGGGSFTLQGGFWGAFGAVQTEGAPALFVWRTTTNTVVVSWPLPDTGWKLSATTNLAASPVIWEDIAGPYATNTTDCYYSQPAPAGAEKRFFRLHKP
jgi:hypothetical protein